MGTGHDHRPIGRYLILLLLIVIMFAGLGIAVVYETSPQDAFTDQLIQLSEELEIFVIDGEDRREIFADTRKWYCKSVQFVGGSNPEPCDLAIPRGPIHYYFFEDIQNKTMADNYSDLIIRMNHVIVEEELCVVVIFFGEGGYGKEVYFNDTLLYTYDDMDPESNYGIRLIKIQTEIDKDAVLTPVEDDKPITDSMLMAIVGAAGAQ